MNTSNNTFVVSYIGYTRVSTTKQGKGVSLIEQKDAISRYAAAHNLHISVWLSETETAANSGRPVFNHALTLLRQKKAKGIILHKLDRGARNLKDWNEIGELSDQGAEIHFAHESVDLRSRGGRLSADIQAVVSADYIRNLRDEARKGFYGRLKQGLYPLPAPLGYLDQGGGEPKSINLIMGPLIRRTYDLYDTGRYSLIALETEMFRLGLRNRNGGRVNKNALARILRNPFYIGIIYLPKTKERFPGIHEPLVRKSVFDRVRAIMNGKMNIRNHSHSFPYRRILTCHYCRYSLIGETQKGRTYYRCHTRNCNTTSIREDFVDEAVCAFLKLIRFEEPELLYFKTYIESTNKTWVAQRDQEIASIELRIAQNKDRLDRLTDAYLDGVLDKGMLESRKTILLDTRKILDEALASVKSSSGQNGDPVREFLELAGSAWLTYRLANSEEKRQLLQFLTSNRTVMGKTLDLKPSIAFEAVQKRTEISNCGPSRDTPRTLDGIVDELMKLSMAGKLPDLSGLLPSGHDSARN